LISGFVLEASARDESYWSFIKRRFSKVFIPYVLWSAIYYLFIYNQNHDNFLRVILVGNASYQLYFIPTLCIFYLLFPFLHKIYNVISNKIILFLLFSSEIFLLYHDYFIKQFSFSDPIHIAILSYFFFIAGIVVSRNREAMNSFIHKWKYLLVSGMVLSGVYVFLEGFDRYLSDKNYLDYYSQWRPSVLIYTVLLALVLFHIFEKVKFQFSLSEKLSKLSFNVFLIHVIFLEGFWTVAGKTIFNFLSGFTIGKPLFDILFFVIVTGLSFAFAYIIQKISKLNKILGVLGS